MCYDKVGLVKLLEELFKFVVIYLLSLTYLKERMRFSPVLAQLELLSTEPSLYIPFLTFESVIKETKLDNTMLFSCQNGKNVS